MNKYIKLVIAGLVIVLGIYLIFNRKIIWGIQCIVFSMLPIFLFFRHEYMLIAFWFLRKQNLEKAKKWLGRISNIESQVFRQQYGYYYYLNGICEAQNNPTKTENFMRKALQLGLKFNHDKALAYLNLAISSISKGRKSESEKYLAKAKKYDKSNMLREQIKMIKEQSKRINIGKNLQNPQIRIRGRYF